MPDFDRTTTKESHTSNFVPRNYIPGSVALEKKQTVAGELMSGCDSTNEVYFC